MERKNNPPARNKKITSTKTEEASQDLPAEPSDDLPAEPGDSEDVNS